MEDLSKYCRETSDRVRSETGKIDFRELNQQERLQNFEVAYQEFLQSVTKDYEKKFREASEKGKKSITLMSYTNDTQPRFGGLGRTFTVRQVLWGVKGLTERDQSGINRLRHEFFDNKSRTKLY